MKEENFEQLVKMELDQLPKYVRDSLASVDWLDALQEVTHEHHIHVDQVGQIRNETLLILLGLTDSPEFVGKVSEIIGDEDEELDKLITDINNRVFLPVREEIMRRRSLKEVENPTPQPTGGNPNPAKSFITQKLNQMDHKVQKKTDHSVKRIENQDPYREPID